MLVDDQGTEINTKICYTDITSGVFGVISPPVVSFYARKENNEKGGGKHTWKNKRRAHGGQTKKMWQSAREQVDVLDICDRALGIAH